MIALYHSLRFARSDTGQTPNIPSTVKRSEWFWEESPNTLYAAMRIAEKTLLTATQRKLRESLALTQERAGSVPWGNPWKDATETFKPPSLSEGEGLPSLHSKHGGKR